MSNVLVYVRKQPFINRLVRNVLISAKRVVARLEKKVYPRWRVSGVVPLKIEDVHFNLYSACDDFTVDELFYGNYSENLEIKLFTYFAREANCILDVGANVGLYSILSGVANPDAQIFAFEPHPTNVLRIKKNIQVNALGSVTVIEKAVGSREERISLTVPDDMRITRIASNDASFSRQFHSNELSYVDVDVSCTSLDHFIDEFQIANIDLVKIDVENFEIEVLKGSSSLFAQFAPVVFCEIHMNEEREIFFKEFIKQYDYQVYVILSNALLEVDNFGERYNTRNFLLAKRNNRLKFYSADSGKIERIVKAFQQSYPIEILEG